MAGRGSPRPSRGIALSGAVALALGGAACANVQAPPGSLPDQVPPRVAEIVPGRDTVVPGFDGSVRVRFDEPVNFPNDLERRLVASPIEAYAVQTGFSDVRLRPRDGWRDGVIYCLQLPSGLVDVLRNRTESPIDFCFSTGPPLSETRVSGTVRDAVSGRPQSDALVLFLALPSDSTPYGWVTGPEGRFELRALPPRAYRVFAFVDRNRDRSLDRRLEPHDSASVEVAPTGTLDLELALVEPDSTAPRLVRAEAVDSLTVRLEFDDPLRRPQPGAPTVTVRDTATGAELSVLALRVGEPAAVELPSPVAEPGDTVGAPDARDTLAAPGPGAAADTRAAPGGAVPGDPATAGAGAATAPDTAAPLPSPVVSVRLADALRPGGYRVSARGFANLRRLVGGGDTTFVFEAADAAAEPDEPEEESPADSPPPAGSTPPDQPPSGERPPDRARRAGEAGGPGTGGAGRRRR